MIRKVIYDTTLLIYDLVDIINEYVKDVLIEGIEIGTFNTGSLSCVDQHLKITTYKEYILVCNQNFRVGIFNKNGTVNDIINLNGKGADKFASNTLSGISIYKSHLYITANYNTITIFSLPDVKFIKKIQCKACCHGICVYKSLIYVTHHYEHEIGVYTFDGELISRWNIDDEFITSLGPFGLSIIDDIIYVADHIGGGVKCYSIKGKYLFGWKRNDKMGFFAPYCILATNDYVYVGFYKCIGIFDRKGNYIKKIDFKNHGPGSIAIIDDTCFVSHSESVKIFK